MTLVQNEKMYYSMEFLEQRWFGRKDLLKTGYSNLQSIFLNVEQLDKRSTSVENVNSFMV